MLQSDDLNAKLDNMKHHDGPAPHSWPENCAGSADPAVVFIGPGPGAGRPRERANIRREHNTPCWDAPFQEPRQWNGGFQHGWLPLVRGIFADEFDITTCEKLIARFNLDWIIEHGRSATSDNVQKEHMQQGLDLVLPVLEQCRPDLVITMDKKAHGAFKAGLESHGWEVRPQRSVPVDIAIPGRNAKHRYIDGFIAQLNDQAYVIVRAPQHPSRIFNEEYGKHCGEAIRRAAKIFSSSSEKSDY